MCDTYFTEGKVATTLEALTTVTSHSYGDWVKGDEKHWKECSCGLKAEEADHSYGNDNICDTCSKETTSGGGSGDPAPDPTPDPTPTVAVRYNVTTDAVNGTIGIDSRYQRNERVTFTVTPDAGYVLKSLTVARKNGTEVNYTQNANGSYSFTMPASHITVKAEFVLAFEDITEDHQFYPAIEWAYQNKLMYGVTETFFDRISPVSRQQVWRVLGRLINGEDAGSMAAAKEWAVAQGIADGTNPGAAATREEFVTMLWIAYGKPAADTAVLAQYPDAAAISADATAAMAWAVSEGIVGGYDDGTLRPAATASRGAFAAILYRYLAK